MTRFEYAPDHHAVTTIEGSGIGAPAITNTVFTDTLGANVLAKYPDGSENWSRDAGGLGLNHTDPMGRVTTFTHDALGCLTAKSITENGTPKTESFSYNPLGNPAAHVLPTGLTQTNAYDIAGRLTYSELIAPDGSRSERRDLAYHPAGTPGAGQLASITDARGVTRAIGYDAFGRVGTETFSGPQPEHNLSRAFAYDRRGLATHLAETGAASITTLQRAFDPNGHIIAETVAIDGEKVADFSQIWDAAGRRSRLDASSPGPFAWHFAHRPDGRLASASAAEYAAEYAFSDAGLLVGRTGPRVTEMIGRDSSGRPILRHYVRAGSALYHEDFQSWNPDGTLGLLAIDDEERAFDYDDRGRLTDEQRTGAGAFGQYAHDYDPGGLGIRAASRAYASDPGSPAWRGDVTAANSLGQSTGLEFGRDPIPVYVDGRARGAGKVGVMIRSVAFGLALASAPWDAEGHWQLPAPARLYDGPAAIVATATHPSGQFSAATTNAIDVAALQSALSQEFDEIGAVVGRAWSGACPRTQSLRRDALGRLVAVEERDPSGRGYDWSGTYDPIGRRIRATTTPIGGPGPEGTVTTTSLYDPEIEFLELGISVAASVSEPPGSPGIASEPPQTSWKLYGPDLDGTYGGLHGTGGLEAIVDEHGTTACLHDFTGNLLAGVDASGAVHWKPIAYSAFGPRADATLPYLAPGVPLLHATDFRGHRREPTGLYYWGARDYDPASASFLSPDPLGLAAGPNRYSFCLNNPLTIHDPDGRLQKGFNTGYNGSGFTSSQIESPFFQIGMVMGGATYGATGGGEILANAWTFGLSDRLGLTQSASYQGSEFAASRILATGSRELGITAMTMGSAQAFRATGRVGWGATAMGLEAYSTYQNASSIVEGSINLAEGNALGALQIGFGALGLRGNLAAFDDLSAGVGAMVARRGAGWFDDVAQAATRNPNSDKLVLGHFSRDSVSYQKVAAHYKATYFKVENWNAVTKGLSQDEIWRINETFLTQQVRQGKQILFSHDPIKARAGSFFEREVSFLRDLGYSFQQKNQWTWEAIR